MSCLVLTDTEITHVYEEEENKHQHNTCFTHQTQRETTLQISFILIVPVVFTSISSDKQRERMGSLKQLHTPSGIIKNMNLCVPDNSAFDFIISSLSNHPLD